jgi:hypothetical protein
MYVCVLTITSSVLMNVGYDKHMNRDIQGVQNYWDVIGYVLQHRLSCFAVCTHLYEDLLS